MLLASSWRTEILLMFNRKQSFIPDWNTVSLTCSIPSIRVGNYSAATQTRTTYVRRDWVTARVWEDVTGTQTPCPSPVKQCFLFLPYKPFVRATGVRNGPGFTFHLSQKQIFFTHNQNILLIGHAEETFHGQTGRCACVLRYRALSRALCELKEAADHSLETQTECAVHWTLSVLRHHALMYSARFVCVRVCVH